MKQNAPQPTDVLIKRLRRVAKWLDSLANADNRARANTCWQAAARLELLTDPDTPTCEACLMKATREDAVGVPLCDECYASLDPST